MNENNLPPGVTVQDIPGNRPRDKEKVYDISLTRAEVDQLKQFYADQRRIAAPFQDSMYETIASIVEQLDEPVYSCPECGSINVEHKTHSGFSDKGGDFDLTSCCCLNCENQWTED